LNFLTGKKTYIVGLGTILGAVGGVMSGALPLEQAVQLVVTALLGMTIRSGINTSAQ
jgi:hypothetical protein